MCEQKTRLSADSPRDRKTTNPKKTTHTHTPKRTRISGGAAGGPRHLRASAALRGLLHPLRADPRVAALGAVPLWLEAAGTQPASERVSE